MCSECCVFIFCGKEWLVVHYMDSENTHTYRETDHDRLFNMPCHARLGIEMLDEQPLISNGCPSSNGKVIRIDW